MTFLVNNGEINCNMLPLKWSMHLNAMLKYFSWSVKWKYLEEKHRESYFFLVSFEFMNDQLFTCPISKSTSISIYCLLKLCCWSCWRIFKYISFTWEFFFIHCSVNSVILLKVYDDVKRRIYFCLTFRDENILIYYD